MRDRPREILVVEDNPGDARLIQEAFKEVRTPHRIVHVGNGDDALAYLNAKPGAPGTALILLDLNLPGRNGREILADIKSTPHLKCIPVVVFTTSESPDDIHQAYNLSANCYVTKPGDLDCFLEVVRVIHEFWLRTVQLPLP